MAYSISVKRGNGYRCSCCSHISESQHWESDRAAALAEVPTTHEGGEYSELLSIEVTDGATGDVIAYGRLDFTGGRSARYSCQRWVGDIDGVPFEELKGNLPGETWITMSDRLANERNTRALREAEAKAAAATAEVARLKKLVG
jgi:hypothetical protein